MRSDVTLRSRFHGGFLPSFGSQWPESAQAAWAPGTAGDARRFIGAAILAVHLRGTNMADNKNDKGDKKSGSDKKSGQGSGNK